jgi:hypothetical protein
MSGGDGELNYDGGQLLARRPTAYGFDELILLPEEWLPDRYLIKCYIGDIEEGRPGPETTISEERYATKAAALYAWAGAS